MSGGPKIVKYANDIRLAKDEKPQECSLEEYETICMSRKSCFEYLDITRPIKLYFDIDYYNPTETYNEEKSDELIDYAKNKVLQPFLVDCFGTEPIFAVATANSPCYYKYDIKTKERDPNPKWKISIHIIVTNIVMVLPQQRQLIKKINEYANCLSDKYSDIMTECTKLFDESVYKPSQKMRSVHSSKYGEDRYLTMTEGTFEESIITCYDDSEVTIWDFPKLLEQHESQSQEPEPKTPIIKKSTSLVDEILAALKSSRFDEYESWFKIGCILKNEGHSVELWDQHSRRSTKYQEGACDKFWRSMNANKEGRALTMSTLWYWLKQDNPSMFYELKGQEITDIEMLQMLNHDDISKVFYERNPDQYLCNDNLGWFVLKPSNIWVRSEKSYPSSLKNHVSSSLKEWVADIKKAEIRRYTKEAEGLSLSDEDKDKQKRLIAKHNENIGYISKAYVKFGTSEFVNGIVSYLTGLYKNDELETIMDANRDLWAFTDCVVDLATGKVRPIASTDYISQTCGYPYPKDTDSSVRTRIMDLLLSIYESPEKAEYTLNVFASCLYGKNRWEELYILTGTGGNGKGVVAELLKVVFGDYFLSVDINLFTKPSERRDQPMPALVEAQNKRLVMSTEPEGDVRLQAGLLKKISGNDIIEARTLNSKHIVKYVPQYKVILQMNDIPKLNRMDDGVRRRMRIIRHPYIFRCQGDFDANNEKHRLADPDIKDKLCKSAEWRNEFILMLLEQYAKIKDWKSLPVPEDVRKSTDEYLDTNNPTKEWLNEFYTVTGDDRDTIKSSDMKIAYMKDKGVTTLSDAAFKQLMELNGYITKKTKISNVYLGLKRKESINENINSLECCLDD